MAGESSSPTADSCDQCPASSDGLPPCDHQGVPGDCASMLSCGSAPAETQSSPLAVATRSVGVIVGTSATPTSPPRSPETPPPRV